MTLFARPANCLLLQIAHLMIDEVLRLVDPIVRKRTNTV
jgi:hypothetical protein